MKTLPSAIRFFDPTPTTHPAAFTASRRTAREETPAEHRRRVMREIKAAEARARVRQAMERRSAQFAAEERARRVLRTGYGDQAARNTRHLIEHDQDRHRAEMDRLRREAGLPSEPQLSPGQLRERALLEQQLRRR